MRAREREGRGVRDADAFEALILDGKQEVAAPAVRPVHGQKEKKKKGKKEKDFCK